MRREYDFSKGTKNPYVSKLPKQQVTIRLDSETFITSKWHREPEFLIRQLSISILQIA